MKSLIVSNDGKTLFIGGGYDDPNSYPKIAAVEFTNDMRLITEQELDLPEFSIIWVMDRFPNSDIIFAGGYGNVSVLFFDGRSFQVIGTVGEGDPADPIVDLRFIGSKLYFMNQPTRTLYRADFGSNDENSTANFNSNPPNDYRTQSLASTFQRLKKDSIRLPSTLHINHKNHAISSEVINLEKLFYYDPMAFLQRCLEEVCMSMMLLK